MKNVNLNEVARRLAEGGKGILAADESTGTIGKRFADISVENIEPNRANWRELMFAASGVEQFISGVITYEETLYQNARAGESFVKLLEGKGIIVGIKVDKSTRPLPGSDGEVFTDGLDGLPGRLASYYEQGARFTKWRAVINIGDGLPTATAIKTNASALATYAKQAQEAGLVPIVEPEVLMDGGHSIERCAEVTERVLTETFAELAQQNVALDGIILKPNMVISASGSGVTDEPSTVAKRTVDCLLSTVPAEVPGIAFLSGGQSSEQAIANLDAINRYAASVSAPWALTFSYGRALQADALAVWGGEPSNEAAAAEKFLAIASSTSLASLGQLK